MIPNLLSFILNSSFSLIHLSVSHHSSSIIIIIPPHKQEECWQNFCVLRGCSANLLCFIFTFYVCACVFTCTCVCWSVLLRARVRGLLLCPRLPQLWWRQGLLLLPGVGGSGGRCRAMGQEIVCSCSPGLQGRWCPSTFWQEAQSK